MNGYLLDVGMGNHAQWTLDATPYWEGDYGRACANGVAERWNHQMSLELGLACGGKFSTLDSTPWTRP